MKAILGLMVGLIIVSGCLNNGFEQQDATLKASCFYDAGVLECDNNGCHCVHEAELIKQMEQQLGSKARETQVQDFEYCMGSCKVFNGSLVEVLDNHRCLCERQVECREKVCMLERVITELSEQLEMNIDEQAEIIRLNRSVQDEARIIQDLNLKIAQQARILDIPPITTTTTTLVRDFGVKDEAIERAECLRQAKTYCVDACKDIDQCCTKVGQMGCIMGYEEVSNCNCYDNCYELATKKCIQTVTENNYGNVMLEITTSNTTRGVNNYVNTHVGITALDLLISYARVNITAYPQGDFVDCINDLCPADNKYWMYYVNGEIATVGAGNYQIQDNDTVEFRYEKYET